MPLLLQALKLSWRGLCKQRLYAVVIVLSLALGLSFSNILVGFAVREQQTDSFHEKKDRLFRLLSDDPFEQGEQLIFVLEQAAPHLLERYPEVAAVCRLFDLKRAGVDLRAGVSVLPEVMALGADSSFFDLFDFPVYEGRLEGALRPGRLVLSRRCAVQLFGDRTVVGKTVSIRVDSVVQQFSVAAVLGEPPQNSHFRFDALVPYDAFSTPRGGATHYLELTPHTSPASLEAKISRDGEMPSILGPGKGQYQLQALSEAYFDESQQRPYYQTRSRLLVYVSWTVVLLVLFTAGFNFLNLIMIAQLKRRRALGVQKVFGASPADLRKLALGEVFLIMLLACVLSALLTTCFLPLFNRAFDADLPFAYLARGEVVAGFAVLLLLISAAFVFFLSAYFGRQDPVALLSNGAIRLSYNKWLFTAQFIVAIAMVFCTVIILRQLQYIEHKPLGFNRQLLELSPPEARGREKMPVLLEQLRRDPGLTRAALASGNPISGNQMVRYELPGGEFYAPYLFWGDSSLLQVLDLELLKGQPLQPGTKERVLVNEQLVRRFGWEAPIGQVIPGSADPALLVTGVVRDFNLVSLKEAIPPVIIGYRSQASRLLLDYRGQELSSLLPKVRDAWEAVFPEARFRFTLVEDKLLERHRVDRQFFRIVAAFALVSVLITCFGLFALAWGVTQSRSREIGIRKVVGATPWQIAHLLLEDYFRWVLLAAVLALPTAVYLMQRWLANFAFHAPIDGWAFGFTALSVVLVTLFSVGFQTVRSAFLNPVDELRNE